MWVESPQSTVVLCVWSNKQGVCVCVLWTTWLTAQMAPHMGTGYRLLDNHTAQGQLYVHDLL